MLAGFGRARAEVRAGGRSYTDLSTRAAWILVPHRLARGGNPWQELTASITAAGIFSTSPGADLEWLLSPPGPRVRGPRRHRRPRSRSARSAPDAWAARLARCSSRRATR